MSDVEIFHRVNGYKLEKFIGLLPGPQAALARIAGTMAAAATAQLTLHKAEGHSRIDVADGKVDKYVTLDDTRGLRAALSIEYGRKRKRPSRGVHALAAGLAAARL